MPHCEYSTAPSLICCTHQHYHRQWLPRSNFNRLDGDIYPTMLQQWWWNLCRSQISIDNSSSSSSSAEFSATNTGWNPNKLHHHLWHGAIALTPHSSDQTTVLHVLPQNISTHRQNQITSAAHFNNRNLQYGPVGHVYIVTVNDGHIGRLTEMFVIIARHKPSTKNQRWSVIINSKLHHLHSNNNHNLLMSVILRLDCWSAVLLMVCVGPRSGRIRPVRFLAGWSERSLNQALVSLCLLFIWINQQSFVCVV